MATTRPQPRARSSSTPASVAAARRVRYIGFLHRVPYAYWAYELGYAVGIREDYTFQSDWCANLDLPIHILDNDFHDPDLDRWLERCRDVQPAIGMMGDAYNQAEAREYVDAAREIKRERPGMEIVIVPKDRVCFEIIPAWVILGYPEGGGTGEGQSNVHPSEYSELEDWRGRRVHILGGSPPRQWDAIQRLTQRTLGNHQPANIVGTDYNGFFGSAMQYGSFWTREGWQNPERGCDHWEDARWEWSGADIIDRAVARRSPRELELGDKLRIGLYEAKHYWRKRGVWPTTVPDDLHDATQAAPTSSVFAGDGTAFSMGELDALYPAARSRAPDWGDGAAEAAGDKRAIKMATEGAEPVVLVEFEDGETLTYRSKRALDFDIAKGGLIERHGEPTRIVNGNDGTVSTTIHW
jgi:hypothetical protein